MRYPLVSKTETWVKNSEPILQLLQSIMFEDQIYWSALILSAFSLMLQLKKF